MSRCVWGSRVAVCVGSAELLWLIKLSAVFGLSFPVKDSVMQKRMPCDVGKGGGKKMEALTNKKMNRLLKWGGSVP